MDSHLTSVRRYGITIGLHPDKRTEYLRLHSAVWPEVEARLAASNMTNFTIFEHANILFGYYEYTGDDHDADAALIAADPATRRWWQLTDPCQLRLPETPDGQQWAPMTEVWHLGR